MVNPLEILLSSPWFWIVLILVILIVAFRAQLARLIDRTQKAKVEAGKEGAKLELDASTPSTTQKPHDVPPPLAATPTQSVQVGQGAVIKDSTFGDIGNVIVKGEEAKPRKPEGVTMQDILLDHASEIYQIGKIKGDKTRTTPVQRLRLDTAVPDRVYLNKAFELAVAVRRLTSPTLAEGDLVRVHSGGVQVTWPQSQSHVRLCLQVSAPDCEIHDSDSTSFRLYVGQDSPVFYFQLTPKKLGDIGIVVKIYQENDWSGSARVHTVAYEQVIGSVQMKITSCALEPDSVAIDWNTAIIRELLAAAFNDEELTALCFDHFQPVYQEFSTGMSAGHKIQRLLDYCERHNQFGKLLTLASERNPAQYARFEGRLRG